MNDASVKARARELQLLHAPRTDVMFHGLSMEPILREGDEVVVEPVAFDQIEVGDIITYRHEDKYPTRRVVTRRRSHLVLWCDNWPDIRFRARASDILGRVVARVRDGDQLTPLEEEWRLRTDQALRDYKRSYPRYLRRHARRAIRYVLGLNIEPLPG